MSNIFEITKQFTFEAAHYFPNMPEGHIYKKINGHSFVGEVTFYGKQKKDNQWVNDFGEINLSLEKIKKKLYLYGQRIISILNHMLFLQEENLYYN